MTDVDSSMNNLSSKVDNSHNGMSASLNSSALGRISENHFPLFLCIVLFFCVSQFPELPTQCAAPAWCQCLQHFLSLISLDAHIIIIIVLGVESPLHQQSTSGESDYLPPAQGLEMEISQSPGIKHIFSFLKLMYLVHAP